jgi:predicted permease
VRIDSLNLGLDGRALLFALLLALASGCLFGLAPALQASRPNQLSALNDQLSSRTPASARLRAGLVASQVALCLVLLIGTLLFARSLWNALHLDLGFRAADLAVAPLDLKPQGYGNEQMRQLYSQMRERLAALPVVQSASMTSALPIVRSAVSFSFKINVQGYQPRPHEDTGVSLTFVGPGYFTTLGTPLLRGRELTAQDGPGAPKVVVVNQSLAKHFWGNLEVLGKQIQVSPEDPFLPVVGVVADAKDTLGGEELPRLYLPFDQYIEFAGPAGVLVVRTRTAQDFALAEVRDAIHAVAPNLPGAGAGWFSSELEEVLRPQRTGVVLLGLLGLLALVLATIGIYGVVALQVSQRHREIGIRLSLGAARPELLRLVLGWGLLPAVAGLAAGVGLALASTRLVSRFLVGVAPTDWASVVVATLMLLAVAVIASLIPADRARRVDPIVVLRQE